METWPARPPRGRCRPSPRQQDLYGPRRHRDEACRRIRGAEGRSVGLSGERDVWSRRLHQERRTDHRGVAEARHLRPSHRELQRTSRGLPGSACTSHRAGGLRLVLSHARYVSQLGPIDRRADVPGRYCGEEGHVDFRYRHGAGAHERAELRGDPRPSAAEHHADLHLPASRTGDFESTTGTSPGRTGGSACASIRGSASYSTW